MVDDDGNSGAVTGVECQKKAYLDVEVWCIEVWCMKYWCPLLGPRVSLMTQLPPPSAIQSPEMS